VRYRATALSVVMWATTLGSVAGPNLSQLGSTVGTGLGIEPLTGPYLFSLIAFAGAALVLSLGLAGPVPADDDHEPAADGAPKAAPLPTTGLVPALRAGLRNPVTRLAIVAVICSHTIMVGVMVMTPLHMTHHGMTLDLVGLVISIHIFGMYGASPIMGWLTDRIGAPAVIGIGVIIFVAALVLGVFADTTQGPIISLALGLLGLGWSAGMIGGSSLLASAVTDSDRVSIQGGTDALMNIAAASSSALSGLVMGLGGFPALNVIAAIVAVPMAVLALRGMLSRRSAVISET
jgi:predicted MFS family arabinose efflux permease